MDHWGHHNPANPSGSESYQFALGSMMGQTATELRNMHSSMATELRSLRTETVTELRGLQDRLQTVIHLAHQLLMEDRTKGPGIMAQITTFLKLLLPFAVLAMVVATKLSWKDLLPVAAMYLKSLGVM